MDYALSPARTSALQRSAAERTRPAGSPAQRAAVSPTRPAAAGLAQLAAIVNPTGLPDALKAGVEALSGQSLDHVRVHRNSAKPAQLNAHAYAQGSDIHVAPGQEKHLPHEAWHVVQQAQGRVKPTMQLKEGGVPINDDHSLEREADVNGTKALALGTQVGREAAQRKRRGAAGLAPALRPAPVVPGSPRDTPVQRYLIVGDHDYTDDANVQLTPLATVTTTVYGRILAAMAPAHFGEGTPEHAMRVFLNGDGAVVSRRQLSKWVEDHQGLRHERSHLDFGRKHQARVYDNYVDLGRALYGWVKAKPGRKEEKFLATQVQASPVVEAHLDAVLTLIHTWVNHPSRDAMRVVLSQDNPVPGDAAWANYRNWFNHEAHIPARLRLPGNFMTVLANPSAHPQRVKIAVLHDVMKYVESVGQLADAPALHATTPAEVPRQAYDRPNTSGIERNPITRGRVLDVVAARADNLLHTHRGVRSSTEETHPTYIYARRHNIPMWARHSHTAASMLAFTRQVGGDAPQMWAVADATMAFWRKDFDHRSRFPYHTLHEIQDFTPDFGMGDYDPLTRYDTTHARLNVTPAMITRIRTIADSARWNDRGYKVKGPNTAPSSIRFIREEVRREKSDVMKLLAIKDEIHNKTGWSLMPRDDITKNFYILLNKVPANLHEYVASTTSRAARSALAVVLSGILRELNAFAP